MRAEGPPGASKEAAKKPPGSRSLIRHCPFLQQNLHPNPDGVWLIPCSVRLCTAFKSPLLEKHTHYNSRIHIIPISIGYHLWHSSVPEKSTFPTFCSCNRVAKLSHKTGNWDCSLFRSDIITNCCWACGEMQPQSLGLQKGRENPQEGSGSLGKTSRMLGEEAGPI